MSLPAECSGLPELKLGLDKVRIFEGPFCISFGPAPDALKRSIQTAGLINLPLVISREGGAWEVVCGHRRLSIVKELGYQECTCRDLGAAGLSKEQIFLVALYDNLATRGLNHVEKALALKALEAFFPEQVPSSDFLIPLGLSSRKGTLEAYRALAIAPEWIRLATASGELSMKAFQALLELPEEGREAAAEWIIKLRMSINNQIQFIELLKDLSEMERVPIRDILALPPASEILTQPEANPPQTTARLMRHLRERRFPRAVSAEKEFQAMLKRAGLPRGVRVSAPPWFEGDKFNLEADFREGPELRRTLEGLLGCTDLLDYRPPWVPGDQSRRKESL